MYALRFLSLGALLLATRLVAADPSVPAAVTHVLATLLPGTAPTSVKPAPSGGLYEVTYGPQIVYISADGRYLFKGDILDLKDHRNLTEDQRSGARLKALDALGEDKMVVFAPAKTRHTVTVFTDIDCPYCVKFHQQVGELNRDGIKVRYVAFPRAGIGSKSYREAVTVWCSDDRQQALTDAKAGRKLAQKSCDNPVKEEYELGRSFGVSGTPTLVLDNGDVLPGYVPARQLEKVLEQGGT